ncbi:MFS transporter [Natronomonas amylolytica]|uniref:MFS transporter n=1 Tax=Natronomonas amylolytica TaxID=3108498 RepID=UPI003AB2FC53
MSRRELFGSLCAMVFLVNLARVVFAPVVQPAAADFDVSAASLGVVTSAAWLGSAAPRLPTGYLLTRVSRHRVVAATGTLLVGTAAFTALSPSVTHLTVGAFLMGLSSGMYFIAANPLVSELFPDRVGRAIGIHGMSSQLAAVVAPLAVSGILLVGDWRTAFLFISALAAAATVFLVFAARRADLPEAGTADRSLVEAGRAQWPIILTGIAFLGAAGFLWNGLFNLYGDYLDVVKGIDPGTGRTLLSLMFAAGVPAFLITGRLADRLPNVPLLLGIVGSFVVSVLALTLAEGVYAVAAVSIVLGYVVHSLFPAVDTYMLASLPDRHRASAYALYSSSMMFVQALGSGSVGIAVSRGVSYTAAFQTLVGLLAVVVVVLFVLYRAGWLPAGGAAHADVATETAGQSER